MSDFVKLLNPGDQIASAITPDNKSIFALTDEDLAFINSVNMQLDMLKTVTISMISHVESLLETHSKVLEHFKDQFVNSLAERHGVANKSGSFSINLENKVFLYSDKKE